jgi:chemotaxis signal transduction protein
MNNITSKSFLLFNISSFNFAIKPRQVFKVVEISKLSPIPNSRKYIAGMLNIDGEVIIVIDPAIKMGLKKETTINELSRILILKVFGDLTGIIIDSNPNLVDIEQNNVQKSFPVAGISAKYIEKLLYNNGIVYFLPYWNIILSDTEHIILKPFSSLDELCFKYRNYHSDEGVMSVLQERLSVEKWGHLANVITNTEIEQISCCFDVPSSEIVNKVSFYFNNIIIKRADELSSTVLIRKHRREKRFKSMLAKLEKSKGHRYQKHSSIAKTETLTDSIDSENLGIFKDFIEKIKKGSDINEELVELLNSMNDSGISLSENYVKKISLLTGYNSGEIMNLYSFYIDNKNKTTKSLFQGSKPLSRYELINIISYICNNVSDKKGWMTAILEQIKDTGKFLRKEDYKFLLSALNLPMSSLSGMISYYS